MIFQRSLAAGTPIGLRKTTGFTLVELIAALTIAAIVITVTVPAFRATIQNNLLATQLNEFIAILNLTRGEAVKRSVNMTICVRATNTDCGNTNNWANGLLVFADADGDGAVDSGEDLIQVNAGLSGNNTLRSSGGFPEAWRLRYDARGRLVGGAAGSFILCDSRGAQHGRAININGAGTLRLATDDDNDNTVNTLDSGGELTCP